MAVVEEALWTHLDSDASLSTSVSSRIYPVRLPQNATLPAVTVTRVSGTRVSAFGSDNGCASARFQVSTWSSQVSEASSVKEEVRSAVQRFSGSVSGVTIDDIFLANERVMFEDDTEIYQWILDVLVHYQE